MTEPNMPGGPERRPLPAEYVPDRAGALDQPMAPYPTFEPEDGGLDVRRYVHALVRYKWLFVLALAIAGGVSYWLWRTTVVQYVTNGTLWIEAPGGRTGPIQTGSLLQRSSWTQLLNTSAVMDHVVRQERLFVSASSAFDVAFSTFEPVEGLLAGSYELRVGEGGDDYVLLSGAGAELERGRIAEGVGASLGFRWAPPQGSLGADAVVPFSVVSPQEAGGRLAQQLNVRMDQEGTFLTVSLQGTNPRRITSIVNTLMRRHVEVAAELSRARLEETLIILEEQLQYTENELEEAERALEEFRVRTISLPTDRSAPIAAGLQLTRDPVFSSFFDMRIEQEQVRSYRARLQEVLGEIETTGEVRIEALELIPPTSASSELRRILDDLVRARSELRVLLDRYSEDYPPAQDLLTQIQTIEQNAIPRVVRGIIGELQVQEQDLASRVSRQSTELEAIPPRTIEEGRLARAVGITETLYNELRGRVETQRLAAASALPEVRILDEAQVPQVPLDDERLRLILLIFAGCLGAAVGGAILLDQTDRKFRYATDVSRDVGLTILGSIPRIQGKRGRQAVHNAAQALESFRELRIHIGFAYGSAGPITLTVTSAAAGEGKSLISSNVAVAFAEVGQRTLLIDGDTRRGDSHRLFGLQQSPGLVDYLKQRSGHEIIQKTGHENLDFIGCGSRGISTPELLASPHMARFVGTLKRSYDVIIVDSPPLASGGDPLILATLTGNLAVVIRTGSTEKQLLQAKLDQLARLPIRILGAILNDVDPNDGYHYYYTSYLPGYEPVPSEEEEEEGVQLISDGRKS